MQKEVSWHTLSMICGLTKQLRPKENMTISQWADRHMILPEGSSESGRYSSETVPYQKAIMDAITDPEVVDVSIMSSSQVGKTLIIICGICYYIDYEPTTQMMVMPTIADGEKFSKTRLAQVFAAIPQIAEKVADPKSRNSNNTILLKCYPGGSISIGGANSPSSLASDPRRVIWMDEVDRFPESAGSEGNPVKLAEKRATTYWNKKHIKTSTPTIKGRSKIEDAYNEGSMEEWSVCCPGCGTWQPYEFGRVNFDDVSMTCKGCGCLYSEREWKDSEHKWIARHPERKRKRSFRLNELASPFVDWEDIIEDWKKAIEKLKKWHDPEDLKVFINTVLGETWDETEYVDDAVDENILEKRAEEYGAEIPEGVLLLTAAVDVQGNRFEVEIRGWARDYESWGIYKTEIPGELIQDEPWDELESYLGQTFHFFDGRSLNVAGFTIDTGGSHTNQCYKWIKKMKKQGKKCFGIKGYAGKPGIRLLYRQSIVEIKEERRGKEIVVDRTMIHILGVDAGKEDITRRLGISEPGPGYCHFPVGRGYDHTYYEGLTSEQQIEKKVNGMYKKVWVKKTGVRNEPFDLLNYNYAAVEILHPEWDVLERKIKAGINYMIPPVTRKAGRKSYSGIEV